MREWSLVAFTVLLQAACGIAAATTVAGAMQSVPKTEAARVLGITVFPFVAVGLLLSLGHLGRPLSGWRAFSNARSSRLSREVILTVAFALAALAYSFACWGGTSPYRLFMGATTSLLGSAAVLASALIYRLPTRAAWNSSWVVTSFIGSAGAMAGLALAFCEVPQVWSTTVIVFGGTLLISSGVRMWMIAPCGPEQQSAARAWLSGYFALIITATLLLIASSAHSLSYAGLILASFLFALAGVVGRASMFAVGETQAHF